MPYQMVSGRRSLVAMMKSCFQRAIMTILTARQELGLSPVQKSPPPILVTPNFCRLIFMQNVKTIKRNLSFTEK